MSNQGKTAADFKFLTDGQLNAQLKKCYYCADKPCQKGCPCGCDPAEFILKAKNLTKEDIKRSCAEIYAQNPFGGVCGVVCPEDFCVAKCTRGLVDEPIDIPAVQAAIVNKAHEMGVVPKWTEVEKEKMINKKVGIIGAGPAGLACAGYLSRNGIAVDLFEKMDQAGGVTLSIPEWRLPRKVIERDVDWLLSVGKGSVNFKPNEAISNPLELMEKNEYDAVCVACGVTLPRRLGLENEVENSIYSMDFLWNRNKYNVGNNVAVIGGGAVAVDCAITAKRKGAENVHLIYRRGIHNMPIAKKELQSLYDHQIDIITNTVIISFDNNKTTTTQRVLVTGDRNLGAKTQFIEGSKQEWTFSSVIVAAGSIAEKTKFGESNSQNENDDPRIFYAGDYRSNASTVVEASANGKNAGKSIECFLKKVVPSPKFPNLQRSELRLNGYELPADLTTDFFGVMKMDSPFLLSASPVTDGYDQMVKAYRAGWPGGVLKTAFHDVPIHIPNQYMNAFDQSTYGNCDNVSGHDLDRVCDEIRRLRKEYPDKVTIGSSGGPVTGNDAFDKAGWQSNTKMLDDAGAVAVEYSLSCPQGGDGSEGSIVSQNAALSAKIIDWVLEISKPDVPKIFKLTGAVTSPVPIVRAIKEVFDRYPNKKAGITLANSFPCVTFKDNVNRPEKKWKEAIVVGMSGQGVVPLSYNTISSVMSFVQVEISGNGGVMDAEAAANFLALGVKNVQVCTLPTKMGIDIIKDLKCGLAHIMAGQKIKCIPELIGRALPNPITDFMELTPVKRIPIIRNNECVKCGNCSRCPYMAITLGDSVNNGYPQVDPRNCIGCSICTLKCPTLAMSMVDRTEEQIKMGSNH